MDGTFLDMADVSGILMANHVWILKASEGCYVLDRQLGYVFTTDGVARPYPIRVEYDGWFRDTETALHKSNEWLKSNRCIFFSFEEALVCWQQRYCGEGLLREFPTDEPIPRMKPINRTSDIRSSQPSDSSIGWIICFWFPLILLLMKGLSL